MSHDEFYYVYKISFKGTDRVYIGYTSTTPEVRFAWHWNAKNKSCHDNTPLYKYLRTINKTDITVETLYVSFDKEDALSAECSIIAQLGTLITENGFNVTIGGENPPPGFGGSSWRERYTEEELKVINKKYARYGEDNGFYGKSHSPETLKKMVDVRMSNGSYANAGSHLLSDDVRRKTVKGQKDAAAKRYGYDSDQSFVDHIIDIYQECGGSYRWIADETGSNKPTIRKRVCMILNGDYGGSYKDYIEKCEVYVSQWRFEIERNSRRAFTRLYIEVINKPKIKEDKNICQQ